MDENILEDIKIWARSRGLDKIEFDPDSLRGNISEEKAEMYEAYARYYRGSNDAIYDVVDAICDGLLYQVADMVKLNYPKSFKYLYGTSFYEAKSELSILQFDINLCMRETLKVVQSRKGEWNDDLKKWKKFTDEDSKSLWYTPDYSKCRYK